MEAEASAIRHIWLSSDPPYIHKVLHPQIQPIKEQKCYDVVADVYCVVMPTVVHLH
jgi:hypothetical protein